MVSLISLATHRHPHRKETSERRGAATRSRLLMAFSWRLILGLGAPFLLGVYLLIFVRVLHHPQADVTDPSRVHVNRNRPFALSRPARNVGRNRTVDASVLAYCRACRAGGATDGGVRLTSAGVCEGWCSNARYCGTSETYRDHTDCRPSVMRSVHHTSPTPSGLPLKPRRVDAATCAFIWPQRQPAMWYTDHVHSHIFSGLKTRTKPR